MAHLGSFLATFSDDRARCLGAPYLSVLAYLIAFMLFFRYKLEIFISVIVLSAGLHKRAFLA